MTEQPLKLQIPVQGWKQFLTARKEMLDSFDSAQEKAKLHKVETSHGKVAESELRKWLSTFLPKRYAVTSGYVISTGFKQTDKAPHFDVIIYDQIESPILWVEDNPDTSYHGRSLAIPAENVLAIIEVKSRFNARTVKAALTHLSSLANLMNGIDEPTARYKQYLPHTFCCGIAFFDLYQRDAFSKTGLNTIVAYQNLRGFYGGLVLRGEGHTKPLTGRISLLKGETSLSSFNAKGEVSLLKMGLADSMRIADNIHIGAMLDWGESNFSRFAFDILAMLKGAYDGRRLSSFHGIGRSDIE